jgi:hypothetical protein
MMLGSRAVSHYVPRQLPKTAAAGTGARGFASEKELKKRMGAVKTIIKITKSTKMIAAAKFKAAEAAVDSSRGIIVLFSFSFLHFFLNFPYFVFIESFR